MGTDNGFAIFLRGSYEPEIRRIPTTCNRRRHPFQGRPDQHVYVIMGRLGWFRTAKNVQGVSNAGANRG
jgi:hypothetical protein